MKNLWLAVLALGWGWAPTAAWSAAISGAAETPSEPAEASVEAYSDSVLAQGLETWNRLLQRIAHLESENLAWEARFNPDREDHNWWNPFWRSTAERHLEQSNAVSLQLLALERRRADLEPRLLAWSEQYVQTLPTRAPRLQGAQREFWFAVDAWRFPIWLRRFQELQANLERDDDLSPELKLRRKQTLERQWGAAKTLEAYLAWRQGQLTLAEVQPKREQQLWERQIQAWLAAVAALR